MHGNRLKILTDICGLGELMKSYTYASLATIVFIKHRASISRSIESVIRSTDALAQRLGHDPTLSHMTKYRIITDLMENDILKLHSSKRRRRLRVADEIISYLQDSPTQ